MAVFDHFTRPLLDPAAARLLDAGLAELPASESTRLVDDLVQTQDRLIGAAFRAAFASGRVEPICPDTPLELFSATQYRFRIREED